MSLRTATYDVFCMCNGARREEREYNPLGGQGGLIISIHALREESDRKNAMQMRVVSIISIHALREESDLSLACWL